MVHFHYGLPVHPWHAYTPASRPAVLPQVALVNSLIRAAGLAPAWRQLHWRTRPQAQRPLRAAQPVRAKAVGGGGWTAGAVKGSVALVGWPEHRL